MLTQSQAKHLKKSIFFNNFSWQFTKYTCGNKLLFTGRFIVPLPIFKHCSCVTHYPVWLKRWSNTWSPRSNIPPGADWNVGLKHVLHALVPHKKSKFLHTDQNFCGNNTNFPCRGSGRSLREILHLLFFKYFLYVAIKSGCLWELKPQPLFFFLHHPHRPQPMWHFRGMWKS